jgi:tRNA threonylcarbamoyladenosine biosynthesis protein TsaE
MLKFLSHSSQETKKIAGLLAKEILIQPPKISSALVLALTGDLGSGKTTFIQGFCRAAGIKKRITSPTFVIFKKFKIKNLKFKNLYHLDCYRIQKPQELLKLGFKEIIVNPQNIVLIEWAEKIKLLLPKETIWIKFSHTKSLNQRLIRIIRN